MYKTYSILCWIFGIGMISCMVLGQVGFTKLFSIGLLWCGIGMGLNSKKVRDWLEKHGR